MIEKVSYQTIVEVLSVIGWALGLYLIARTAIRYLADRHRPESRQDENLAAHINGSLLRETAHQLKDLNDQYHQLATKLAVLESRQQVMEAEIRKPKR